MIEHIMAWGASFKKSKNIQVLQLEAPEYDQATPELRLWLAVIIMTVCEYEEMLNRIVNTWKKYRQPINRLRLNELYSLRFECRNPWFDYICEMANISPAIVFRRFDRLDEKYAIHSIKFTDLPRCPLKKERQRRVKRLIYG